MDTIQAKKISAFIDGEGLMGSCHLLVITADSRRVEAEQERLGAHSCPP